MNKFQRRIVTALAAGSLLLNAVVPVFATTTIEISGNGSGSDNDVELEIATATVVDQTNTATISNDVDASAETGENKASGNTGGDVSIETGDATVKVDVANSVNSNVAEVECCGPGDVDVLISGNGSNSDNTVDLDMPDDDAVGPNGTFVTQTNTAYLYNSVEAEAETGENEAKDNTGGDVSITTGDATVSVGIVNEANANYARVSGDGSGSVSAWILDNGTGSDNDIELEIASATVVDQTNDAYLSNDVDAEAETGENKAKDNTGGTVSIDTGDAEVDVTVDNFVNFNWADIACDCLLDVLLKIAGNGSDSDNTIEGEISSEQFLTQANDWSCKDHEEECTDVEAEAETGENEAKDNTVGGEDPTIETGAAEVTVDVSNTGNANVDDGGLPPLDWPDWPDLLGGFSVNITLDLSLLLALLGLA